MSTSVKSSLLKPNGFQQITDVSSAVGLTVPVNTRYALIQVLTANVRWRDDGTSPTATVGIQIVAGDPPFFYNGEPGDIEFIEEEASAEINVSYYS